jgi:hypothetical protein
MKPFLVPYCQCKYEKEKEDEEKQKKRLKALISIYISFCVYVQEKKVSLD